MTDTPTRRPHAGQRLIGLDLLRAIAALVVALTHFTTTYDRIYGFAADGKPPMINLGEEGVGLFFIISGFVILMTLRRSESTASFLTARFLRLYPVFWVAILVTFLVTHLCGLPGREVSLVHALINGTMIPSVFGVPPVDPVYWTLTVEIFFYGWIALIFAMGQEKNIIPIAAFFVTCGILDSVFNIEALLPRGGYRLRSMLILPHWHYFLLGIIAYDARSGIKLQHILGTLLCLVASYFAGSWQGLATTAILLAIVHFGTRLSFSGRSAKLVLVAGAVSYPFYLTHANIGYLLMNKLRLLDLPSTMAIAVSLAVTILLAVLLWRCVERPTAMLKEAILKRKFEFPTVSQARE